MDTKRCLSCRKVLRADAHSCSRCGYVFSQATSRRNGNATNGSRHSTTASFPSNPPASQHRAGHYSGFHPEDQPFQSSFMPVQRPPAITRRLVEQESDEILQPVTSASTAVSQQMPATELPVPEQLPRRFVASPAPSPMPMPQRYAGTRPQTSAPVPQLQFVGPPLPPDLTLHEQITAPLPEPVYLPGNRQPRNRIARILLLASCLFFLLATSILAFLLLDNRPGVSIHPAMKVDHIRGQQGQFTAPKLQLPPSPIDFGAVSTQNTITLINTGGGQINWLAGVDSNSPWLVISPKKDTFAEKEAVKLIVSRGNLTSRVYTGYITFYQQGTYEPLTLTVIMTVNPSTPTVTVSPPPATVTVGPPPVPAMVVKSTALAFSAIQGNNPAPQTFTITNTGNAPLNWAITEDANATAFAPVSPSRGAISPGQSATVTVKPNIAGSTAGVITGHITISDTDKGTPVQSQQVTVRITISNQAVISVSNASLSFNQTSAITNSSKLLVITNSGSAPLNWTLSQPLPSWLSVDIPGGTLSPGTSTFVNVTSDSTGLPVGTYTYTLVVSDTDTNTLVPPQKVPVTLTVT